MHRDRSRKLEKKKDPVGRLLHTHAYTDFNNNNNNRNNKIIATTTSLSQVCTSLCVCVSPHENETNQQPPSHWNHRSRPLGNFTTTAGKHPATPVLSPPLYTQKWLHIHSSLPLAYIFGYFSFYFLFFLFLFRVGSDMRPRHQLLLRPRITTPRNDSFYAHTIDHYSYPPSFASPITP